MPGCDERMTSSQDDAWAEQEPLQVKSEEVKLAMATGWGRGQVANMRGPLGRETSSVGEGQG